MSHCKISILSKKDYQEASSSTAQVLVDQESLNWHISQVSYQQIQIGLSEWNQEECYILDKGVGLCLIRGGGGRGAKNLRKENQVDSQGSD